MKVKKTQKRLEEEAEIKSKKLAQTLAERIAESKAAALAQNKINAF